MIPLDPVLARWYARIDELGRELPEGEWPDRARARAIADRVFAEFGDPGPDGLDETELEIPGCDGDPGVRVRVVCDPGGGRRPVMVLVHGGGFAFGSIDDASQRGLTRGRARNTGCAVIDVEYRLAPEHPFPAGLRDVERVLAWLATTPRDDLDAGRVVVCGISAGAALAVAAVAGSPSPVRGLLLEMPSLDLRPDGHWIDRFAAVGGVPPRADVRKYYLAGADPSDPRASPIVADVTALPPTHVMVAELDPLREAGEVFAIRMRTAGIPVTVVRHLGATHGSSTLTGAWQGARLWESEAVAATRAFLS